MAVDGVVGDRWETAKNKEDVLRFHGISRQPSVFEVLFKVISKGSQTTVLDRCADWLGSTLPKSLGKLQLFGCCDVVEPVFIHGCKGSVMMLERFRVMMKVKPPAYPELGDRFEALHSLMFGSKRLCERISKAFGKEVKVITGCHIKTFALLRLPPTSDLDLPGSSTTSWLLSGDDKLV